MMHSVLENLYAKFQKYCLGKLHINLVFTARSIGNLWPSYALSSFIVHPPPPVFKYALKGLALPDCLKVC